MPGVRSFVTPPNTSGQNQTTYNGVAFLRKDARVVSTSFQDVGLNMWLAPNTSYYFRFFCRVWSDATTTGARFALNGPAGASFRAGAYIGSTTAIADNGVVTAYDTAFMATLTGTVVGTELPVWVDGWIDTGAAAGALSLRFAAEVVSPGTVSVGAGSFGILDPDDSRVVVSTADVTNTSTSSVLADAADLAFAVNRNTNYAFRFVVFYTTDATTTGARFAINGPSGTVRIDSIQGNGPSQSDCGTASAIETIICAATTGPGTTATMAYVTGTYKATANGTVQLRFVGENVAGATMTVLRRSFGEITVMA
jgi:hypothetical protein